MSLISKRLVIDAISATCEVGIDLLTGRLRRHLGANLSPCRPLPGRQYDHAVMLTEAATDRPLGMVMWGGTHQHPHVFATGTEHYDSPAMFDALRAILPGQFLPSRVDVAWDFDERERFDELAEFLKGEALRRRMKLNYQGDWERGIGRTLYVGSRDSEMMLRLYEYRSHHGYGPDVRLELEIKASRRPKRAQVAALDPSELLSLSPVLRSLLKHWRIPPGHHRLHAGPRPVGSLERDTAFLANTAWPALCRLVAAHLGDVEAAYRALVEHRERKAAVLALCRQQATCDNPGEMSHRVTADEPAQSDEQIRLPSRRHPGGSIRTARTSVPE